MRVAVCLSGQPRHPDLSIPSIISNLVKPNKADVFFHTWWNENLCGKDFDSTQPQQIGKIGKWHIETAYFLNMLNSSLSLIEEPKQFNQASTLKSAPTANQNAMCSVFYSQWKVGQLKRDYEQFNDFKYDIVIRTRMDMFIGAPIIIEALENNTVLLASKWQDIRQVNIPGLGDYTMDDNFAVATSETIDKYLTVYPNIQRLNSLINPPFAENYLGWHCKTDNSMIVKTRNFPIEISQRMIR